MLIDTRQIVSKSQLRQDLTQLLLIVGQGQELVVSDRGKLVAKMSPLKSSRKNHQFDVLAATQNLRKSLSLKNPRFNAVEALREIRYSQ